MHNILETTFKNGAFVPDQKFDNLQEGKKFTVILLDEEERRGKKEKFFNFIKEHNFSIPKDYKFNRDEIYER